MVFKDPDDFLSTSISIDHFFRLIFSLGAENQIQHMQYGNNYNRGNLSHSQAQSFCFQSSTVTYGGPDGAYYTSSRTRRTGSDGVSNLSHGSLSSISFMFFKFVI